MCRHLFLLNLSERESGRQEFLVFSFAGSGEFGVAEGVEWVPTCDRIRRVRTNVRDTYPGWCFVVLVDSIDHVLHTVGGCGFLSWCYRIWCDVGC